MMYVVIFLAIATLGALVAGVVLMARGGEIENERRQNKFMVYRIWFQAAAIAVLALSLYIAK